MLDIVNRLKAIPNEMPSNNYDTYSAFMFKTCAIWNNQIDMMKDGSNYSFLSPAAFVEVEVDDTTVLGLGYTQLDLLFKVHILNEMLDNGNNTLDQDVTVFELRAAVLNYLNGFRPAKTGNLMYMTEEQDYSHDNCYHYILTFKAAYVEVAGNRDPVPV